MLELCVMQSPRLGERRLLTLLPPMIDQVLRVYDIRDPIDGLGHAMIDTRLTRLRTGITSGYYADQVPSTGFLQHQRATAVALKAKK